LISAQLSEAMAAAIGPPEEHVRRGEIAPLLDWLRENVHPVGRAMNAEQLVQTVSGRALTSEPFLSYLEDKLDRVLATSPVCGT
jgi:carboxypeptidase Taq